jgi:DNA-binding NarL/FixJ family response regulator
MRSSASAFRPTDARGLVWPPDVVATFAIGEDSFLVLPLDNEGRLPQEALSKQGAIVGEFATMRGRFAVVCAADALPLADEEQHHQSLNLLTKRELQIVVLVAEGNCNKQIAERLRISEWTVSTHLRRIFAKLRVDSRAAMVYRCTQLLVR